MSPELDDKLVSAYPEIFKNRHGNMRETAMCWGFECADGWYTLLDTLCRGITFHLKHNAAPNTPPVVALQVKEKFGTLRFYVSGGDERTTAYIAFAENMSGRICETCGNVGKTRGLGWRYTACDAHSKPEDLDEQEEETKASHEAPGEAK